MSRVHLWRHVWRRVMRVIKTSDTSMDMFILNKLRVHQTPNVSLIKIVNEIIFSVWDGREMASRNFFSFTYVNYLLHYFIYLQKPTSGTLYSISIIYLYILRLDKLPSQILIDLVNRNEYRSQFKPMKIRE